MHLEIKIFIQKRKRTELLQCNNKEINLVKRCTGPSLHSSDLDKWKQLKINKIDRPRNNKEQNFNHKATGPTKILNA